jgi:hypothetical protein
MGIVFTDNSHKSELQERITAELREKQKRAGSDEGNGTAPPDYAKSIDGVDDSRFAEDFRKTGHATWVWIVVGFVMVAGLIFLLAQVK